MSTEKRIMSHNELTAAVAAAALAALKAGMSKEDVAAVLTTIAGLVEAED